MAGSAIIIFVFSPKILNIATYFLIDKMSHTPLKTFIIYARNDKAHKDELRSHLKPLVSANLIEIWHDDDLKPGEEWEIEIKKNLKASQIVLVLVTKHSLNSDFIQTQELEMALIKMKAGNTLILPIIVAPCLWQLVPIFRDLQCLPKDAKAVTTWQEKDEAWISVAEGVYEAVKAIHAEAAHKEEERLAKIAAEKQEKERLEKQALEKAERERLERIEKEKQERERLAKIATEKAEKERLERLATEQRIYNRPAATKTFSTPVLIGGGATILLIIILGITQPCKTSNTNPKDKTEIASIDKPTNLCQKNLYLLHFQALLLAQ